MKISQFEDIVKWQGETFPNSNTLSKIHHLAEEVAEVYNAVSTNDEETRLEFADCFILLMGSAASHGMTYEDICNAIAEKMAINKKRTWGKEEENGIVRHLK